MSKEKVLVNLFYVDSVQAIHIELKDMHVDADYSCTFSERMN